MNDRPVAAAILAGGLARRLGGIDKAALRLGDARIVDRQLARLREVADPIFVVAARQGPSPAPGVEVIADLVPGAGPLGGIYTAIAASPRPRTLVVAGDLPFLPLPLLRLLARPSDADVVVPRSARGYEPLCATWSTAAAEVVRRRIERGALKASLVMEELRVEEIGPELLETCDPHGLLFVNVNTPHDYERARELIRMESDG